MPTDGPTQNLRLTGTDAGAVRRQLRSMDLAVDFTELTGDLPLPLLRMIDLARALARDPELLLLDEITAALPSDLAERVFAVMSERREHGRSVLFITHRLKEVIATYSFAKIVRSSPGYDFAKSSKEDRASTFCSFSSWISAIAKRAEGASVPLG